MGKTSQEAKSKDARLRQQADRGRRAKALLDNPLLQQAFDEIEQEVFQIWHKSAPNEEEKRHNAYLSIGLLKELRGKITRYVRTGESAVTLLKQAEELDDNDDPGQRPN